MRRQTFIYALPSQDDSSVRLDSDSSRMISSLQSYPETIWPQTISPHPVTLFPHHYPYFHMTDDQFLTRPNFFNAPVPSYSLNILNDSRYKDAFSGVHDMVNSSPISNTPHADGFFSEENLYGDGYYNTTESMSPEISLPYPLVTNYGVVTILLRHLVRVDVSPGKAVCVTNPPSSCVAAINGSGDKSCVIHPNGRVFHDGPDIHMVTLNRKAKISRRGVVYTSTDHCLSYLVDASGTKTTSEKFRDLNNNFCLNVFYNDAMSCNNLEKCFKMVDDSMYKNYRNGDEVWFLGGFRIKQDQKGDVKVNRNSSQVIRSSPTTGQVSVKTLKSEVTISRYPNSYFMVRRDDKQVYASVRRFNVQNGTQKSGFNSCGRVVLF